MRTLVAKSSTSEQTLPPPCRWGIFKRQSLAPFERQLTPSSPQEQASDAVIAWRTNFVGSWQRLYSTKRPVNDKFVPRLELVAFETCRHTGTRTVVRKRGVDLSEYSSRPASM